MKVRRGGKVIYIPTNIARLLNTKHKGGHVYNTIITNYVNGNYTPITPVSTPAQPQQQTQTQQDVIDSQTQKASSNVSDFAKMTESEQAKAIIDTLKTKPLFFLEDTPFQRFMFGNQFGGKPEVVDDSELDKMAGKDLYRTVNGNYNNQTDVGVKAWEIGQQIQQVDYTQFSNLNGSAIGRGIYFADDYSHSVNNYGKTKGNIDKTAVVRAKLNSNARVINYNTIYSRMLNEINRGTTLGRALNRVGDRTSQVSIYALAKGYNVVEDNWGTEYYSVLDRSALTMSKDVKATGSKWK